MSQSLAEIMYLQPSSTLKE